MATLPKCRICGKELKGWQGAQPHFAWHKIDGNYRDYFDKLPVKTRRPAKVTVETTPVANTAVTVQLTVLDVMVVQDDHGVRWLMQRIDNAT